MVSGEEEEGNAHHGEVRVWTDTWVSLHRKDMHLYVYLKMSLSSIFSLLSSLLSSLFVLSCLVLSCLVLSCLVLSCLVLSCLVLSCLVLSCLVLSCLVLSCLVLSCLVLSYGVCWLVCACVGACVCWRAAHSPQFPSGGLEYNSFIKYIDWSEESGTCCSRPVLKLENGKDRRVSSGEPLSHVITLPGPFMATRQLAIRDRPNIRLRWSWTWSKTLLLGKIETSSLPCVDSTRRRVYVQHVSVYTGNTRTPVYTETCWTYTRLRVESTHGFFSVSHTTHTTQTTPEREEKTEEKNTWHDRRQKTEDTRPKTEERGEERRREKMKETREEIRRSRDQEKMKLNCFVNCPPSGN